MEKSQKNSSRALRAHGCFTLHAERSSMKVCMFICLAGYVGLPIVLLYLLRCLVYHMLFKTRRNSGSLYRVIGEVFVVRGLLVVAVIFYKKLKNVSCEYDRLNGCKLRGTFDTFVGRAYSIFHL